MARTIEEALNQFELINGVGSEESKQACAMTLPFSRAPTSRTLTSRTSTSRALTSRDADLTGAYGTPAGGMPPGWKQDANGRWQRDDLIRGQP